MYNTKFILENNKEIYPGYIDLEYKKTIKNIYGNKRKYMKCGCRPDANLYYRISEDNRIYPEHNNYVHDKLCCRYKDAEGHLVRTTGYVVNDETGEITAYLKFNPKQYSPNDKNDNDKEQDNRVPDDNTNDNIEEYIVEKMESENSTESVRKEPNLSLPQLTRCINVDSYTEKILNNKTIKSKEIFSTYVYYRMKKVAINHSKKTLGELNLKNDGVRFVYLPVKRIEAETINGMKKNYIITTDVDGKEYKNLVSSDTIIKEIKKYRKNYNSSSYNNSIMLSGFQYIRKAIRSKREYKLLGRINLFEVSNKGLYCRNTVEKQTYNRLEEITEKNPDIKFFIPPEDESIGAVISINNIPKKLLIIFRTKKDEPILFDKTQYVLSVIDDASTVTENQIRNLLK